MTDENHVEPAVEPVEVPKARYRITGLVDHFDEQGNILGQLPTGSLQELPVEYGDRCVDQGQAEKVD